MIQCCSCKENKPRSEFHKGTQDGLASWCKTCVADYGRTWRQTKAGKQSKKRFVLKSKYGMSLEEYRSLLKLQDNKCGICSREIIDGDLKKGPRVDHDHITGAIRGLLCNDCNRAVGLLGDTEDSIRKALVYLIGEQG